MLFKIDQREPKWEQSTTALSASRIRESYGDEYDLESVPRPQREDDSGVYYTAQHQSTPSEGLTSLILSRHTVLPPPQTLVPARSYYSALPTRQAPHPRLPYGRTESIHTAPPVLPSSRVAGPLEWGGAPKMKYNIVNHYSPVIHVHMMDRQVYQPPTEQALRRRELKEEDESISAFHSSDFCAEASLSQLNPMDFESPPRHASPIPESVSLPFPRTRRLNLKSNATSTSVPISAPRSMPISTHRLRPQSEAWCKPTTIQPLRRPDHLNHLIHHHQHSISPSTHRLIAPSATSGRRRRKEDMTEEDSVIDWGDCLQLNYWRQVLCCE